MGYRMKGFSGFGDSPVKQKKKSVKKILKKVAGKAVWPLAVADAAYTVSQDKSKDSTIEKIGKAAWDTTGGFATDILDLGAAAVGSKQKNVGYPWDWRISKKKGLHNKPDAEKRKNFLDD